MKSPYHYVVMTLEDHSIAMDVGWTHFKREKGEQKQGNSRLKAPESRVCSLKGQKWSRYQMIHLTC